MQTRRDLDLDPMTLTHENDLDILTMYLCVPKTKFADQGYQTLEHEQDRQTDAHRQTYGKPN